MEWRRVGLEIPLGGKRQCERGVGGIFLLSKRCRETDKDESDLITPTEIDCDIT
jgi:hypothetical protein